VNGLAIKVIITSDERKIPINTQYAVVYMKLAAIICSLWKKALQLFLTKFI